MELGSEDEVDLSRWHWPVATLTRRLDHLPSPTQIRFQRMNGMAAISHPSTKVGFATCWLRHIPNLSLQGLKHQVDAEERENQRKPDHPRILRPPYPFAIRKLTARRAYSGSERTAET